MVYLTFLARGEMARFLDHTGTPVVIRDPVEILSEARIPLDDLRGQAAGPKIQEATENAQRDLAEAFTRITRLEGRDTVVMILDQVQCLNADAPPHPIYDQPPEWDEDLGTLVTPENALVTGYTQAMLGWVYYATLAVCPVEAPPQGDRWQTFEHPPFWAHLPKMDNDFGTKVLKAAMKSVEGRSRLASNFGAALGIGSKPPHASWAHERWPDLGT